MSRTAIVLIAAFSFVALSSTEVVAQRLTPLRNLGRPLGMGWGQGYHFRNPGPVHPHGGWNSWELNDASCFQSSSPADHAEPRAAAPDPESAGSTRDPFQPSPPLIRLVPEDDVIEKAYGASQTRSDSSGKTGSIKERYELHKGRPETRITPAGYPW